MPKVKIDKFDSGGKLSFLVENNRFDIDENAMDAHINDFIESDPRLRKNRNAFLKEYQDAKSRLRQGATTNQFYNIDVGGDKAINIKSDLNLTNAQRGLDEKGKVAKPGLFSGAKDAAVLGGAINKFFGDTVARAYNQYTLDKAAKDKLDADAAEKERLKQEAEAKSTRERDSTRLVKNLSLGNSYYGSQLGDGDYSDINYRRYHSGKDADRKLADINYIRQLQTAFADGNELIDDDFKKGFTNKSGMTYDQFANALKNIKTNDPKFNMQSAMDSIGLGGEYVTFKDRSRYDNMLLAEKAEKAKYTVPPDGTPGTPETPPEETKPVVPEGYKQEVTTEKQLQDNAAAFATSGEGYTSFSPSYYTYGNTINYGGKKYTAGQYLNYQNQNKIYNEGLTQLASGILDNYNAAKEAYNNNQGLLPNGWTNFKDRNGANYKAYNDQHYNNPYYEDSYSTGDIEGYNDVTGMFSSAIDPSNGKLMRFSVVDEQLKNGDIRSRYIDSNGEYLGYYTLNDKNEGIFHAVDGNNNVVATKNLGVMSQEALNKNLSASGRNTYAWKASRKHRIKTAAKNNAKSAKTVQQAFPQIFTIGRGTVPIKKTGGVLLKFANGGSASMGEALGEGYSVRSEDSRSKGSGVNLGTVMSKGYQLTSADKKELAGLALDLGSLATGIATGNSLTSIPVGIMGAAGTALSISAAEERGEKIGMWDKAMMYGLDAASAIPFAGLAAKTSKVGKTIKTGAKLISKIASSYGMYELAKAGMALHNGDMSVKNIQTVLGGITAFTAGRKANTRRGIEFDPNKKASYSFRDAGTKKKINFTPEEAIKFRSSDAAGKQTVLQSAADRQKITIDKMPSGKWARLDGEFVGLPTRFNTKRISSAITDDVSNYKLRDKPSPLRISATKSTIKRAENYYGSELTGKPATTSTSAPPVTPVTPVAPPPANGKPATTTPVTPPVTPPASTATSQVVTPPVTPATSTTNQPVSTPTPATPRRNIFGNVSNSLTETIKNDSNKIRQNLTQLVMSALNKTQSVGYGIKIPVTSPKQYVAPTAPVKNTKVMPKRTKIATKKSKVTYKKGPNGNIVRAQQGVKIVNPFETLVPNGIKISNTIGTGPKAITASNPFRTNIAAIEMPKYDPTKLTIPTKLSVPASLTKTNGVTELINIPKAKYTDNRSTFSLKANPIDISEAARALNKILTTNKIDTTVEAPLMSNTLENGPSVKSNIGLKSLYATMGNRLRTVADQNVTSDAGINLTHKLKANAGINEFQLQGDVQDAESVLRQQAEANALNRQYAANRTAVANQNASTIGAKLQSEKGLRNEKIATNLESVDNLWSSLNAKAMQRQRDGIGIKSQMAAHEATLKPLGDLGTQLGLDPNKTYAETLNGIMRDMDDKQLLQKEANGTLTNPEDKLLLNKYRSQIEQLKAKAESAKLQMNYDLLSGKQNLFSFKYGARNPITQAVYAKGGKMTFEQKQILKQQEISAKKEAAWIKEYNGFIKDKSEYFLKATLPSATAINDIIKNIYKPKHG